MMSRSLSFLDNTKKGESIQFREVINKIISILVKFKNFVPMKLVLIISFSRNRLVMS